MQYDKNKHQMSGCGCCGGSTDFGGMSRVLPLYKKTLENRNFRTTFWTGEQMQVTLMCLNAGEDIGAETHPHTDQMLYITEGRGIVQFGMDACAEQRNVMPGDAVFVPAGTHHNLRNIGNTPLKLFSIYALTEHPFGTVHKTKADAIHYGD